MNGKKLLVVGMFLMLAGMVQASEQSLPAKRNKWGNRIAAFLKNEEADLIESCVMKGTNCAQLKGVVEQRQQTQREKQLEESKQISSLNQEKCQKSLRILQKYSVVDDGLPRSENRKLRAFIKKDWNDCSPCLAVAEIGRAMVEAEHRTVSTALGKAIQSHK